MAPIAYCRHSDCLDDISENWTDLSAFQCKIQTWTSMHYAGPSFKDQLPIHNCLLEWDNHLELVDVVTKEKLQNPTFNTSFMGKLILPDSFPETEIFAGMPLRPRFTDKPRGRMMDLWFELDLPKDFDKQKVPDNCRGMQSKQHEGLVRFK